MRHFPPAIVLLLLPLVCAACSSESAKAPEAKAEALPPLTGWKNLKFGMSFSDALAEIPQISWNAYAMNECLDVMATKGCFLSADEGEAFAPDEGIPFSPQLSFNKFGKLTDINLQYEQRTRITRVECLELHERTLDRLTREVGTMRFPDEKKSEKPENDATREVRPTAGRARYSVWSKNDGSAFVTQPMRTHFEGVALPTTKPIPQWNDQAYVSLMSTFITVDGDPICSVSVSYESSPKVPRREIDETDLREPSSAAISL